MNVLRWLATVVTIPGALAMAAPAHADGAAAQHEVCPDTLGKR